jgi:hypothetical protein
MCRALVIMAATGVPVAASATQLFADSPDWNVSWNNTLSLSTIYRLDNGSSSLLNSFRTVQTPSGPIQAPQALNFNAGDQNFQKRGFVSERVAIYSALDAEYKHNFGFRLSGDGWYDAAYHRSTDATDPFVGQTPINSFPSSTMTQAGQDAELLDAFAFAHKRVGRGVAAIRLGQYALQYGESLFFGDNGIAAAQSPIDIYKLLSSPNAKFNEIIRPVPQVSGVWVINTGVTIGAYYQFQWKADRLPPSGSYFSTANIPWGSVQPEFVGIAPPSPIAGNYVLGPGAEGDPSNSGQFGAELKWNVGQAQLGFYAAQYHAKDGQLYGALNVLDPAKSSWYYVFPKDIRTAGFSVTRTFGALNLAGEASIRTNMPLVTDNILYPEQFSAAPRYPTGRTAHVNISWIYSMGPTFLAPSGSFVGELAWNRVLSKNDPNHEINPTSTRDASAIQLLFTPSYTQVLPGLDLNVPIGLRYTLSGFSSVTAWGGKHNGTFTVGLNGLYEQKWNLDFQYAHYLGHAVPFVDFSPVLAGGNPVLGTGNPLADRDYVSLNVSRTF